MPLIITLYVLQEITIRNSLAVQWLGPGAFIARAQVPLVGELRSASTARPKKKKEITRHWAAVAAKSLQLCPTLCYPIDGSPLGSSIPGILQARTLEWVAISFSNAWEWKVKVRSLSRVRLFATPWTAAHQAPPSMGFSRQEHWSGVPLPSPGTVLGTLDIRARESRVAPLREHLV